MGRLAYLTGPVRSGKSRRAVELAEKYRVPVVLTSKGAPGDTIRRIHGWGAVALHDIASVGGRLCSISVNANRAVSATIIAGR